MRNSRRREQITERIDAFINNEDENVDHLSLSLYCRDIKFFVEAYPQLTFEKG